MSMIEVNTAALIGPALNWAVAKATGASELKIVPWGDGKTVSCIYQLPDGGCWANHYSPSTDWDQIGPLLETRGIVIGNHASGEDDGEFWGSAHCFVSGTSFQTWAGIKVAACRAIVAAEFGSTVQVPAELVTP